MTKRIVVAVLVCSLTLLPAGLGATGLAQWVGCHNEALITQTGDKIDVVYDNTKVYQRFSYWVRSYGGDTLCKVELIELRHRALSEPAANNGLRDPDSLKRFYRTDYSNVLSTATPTGTRKSYIDVLSGPEGYLIEILTLYPIAAGPKLEDGPAVQQAMDF